MSTPTFAQSTRYGDFLSAQMKSLRKFGYGMFVCKMQAATGPSCSTFWLYSDAPSPGCMPEIAQLWRWNEFDFEFVPFTKATQNSYAEITGSFPKPTVDFYGSQLDLDAMPNGIISQNSPYVSWVKGRDMIDNTVMGDMQKYYNKWMKGPGSAIPSTQFNLTGAIETTGPGHKSTGSGSAAGWPDASQWKYPLTATNNTPSKYDMSKMAALNVWRTPKGLQSVDVNLPSDTSGGTTKETYDCIIKEDSIKGSTATTSMTAAVLNNETYVLPGSGSDFDPYSDLNTYTLVWTPSRVAFFINAGSDGKDVENSTPIMVYDVTEYPSLSQSGTQAAQGKITWADTSLTDELGHVSINLANYVAYQAAKNLPDSQLSATTYAGDGWSGAPPAKDWAGDDALFRSIKYYPLKSEKDDGTKNSDFTMTGSDVWGFDMADGTWTADNFKTRINEYFGILYAQDHTHVWPDTGTAPLRDSKSPLAVSFDTAADGNPVMKLSCGTSTDDPQRNFFRLGTTMNTGTTIDKDNPFMFVTCEYGGNSIPCSGASTPLAFFAPAKGETVEATINLYMSKTFPGAFPSGHVPSAPDATATLELSTSAQGDISWSVKANSDKDGIVEAFQSQNPHLITITPGSAKPGS